MWMTKSLVQLEQEGLVQLGRGKVISKKDLAANVGSYPVYSSSKVGDGKFGEYGPYMFDEELITWSVDGGGRLFHREKHKFSITNVTGFLRILDTSVLSYKYLFYALSLLHSKINFDWVKKAHPSVLRKEYTCIPLPPLAEQHLIVAKLDAAFAEIDRAIETCAHKIEQSNQLFDALVFERFTKSSDDEPVELKELTKELLTGPFGSALHKSDYVENGIAVINPQNLIDGEIIPSDGKFITEKKFEDLKRYELKENDIVIARRGEMGRCALVPALPYKMICGTGCMILRTNDDCCADFVAELIQSKYVRNALEQGAIGATMLNLNQGILLGVKVQAKTASQQHENTAYIGEVRDIMSDYKRLKSEKMQELLSLKSAILAQELQPPQSEAA